MVPSDRVRTSCAKACGMCHEVTINLDRIRDFVATTFPKDNTSALESLRSDFEKRLASPLIFDDIRQEINFSVVSDLLQFGSGYRLELTKENNRGASDTMAYGMFGLHMTHGNLDADTLRAITLQEVSEMFSLPLDEEYEMSPGIRGLRASALKPLAVLIHTTLRESASTLISMRYKDFADFVYSCNTPGMIAKQGGSPRGQNIITELVRYFPVAFADEHDVAVVVEQPSTTASSLSAPSTPSSSTTATAGASSASTPASPANGEQKDDVKTPPPDATTTTPTATAPATAPATQTVKTKVTVYKKAQLAVANLYTRFKDRDASHFAFSDMSRLTLFADNVIPAMMHKLGLIGLSEKLSQRVASNTAVTAGQAFLMRAGAVVVGEIILDIINEEGVFAPTNTATATDASANAAGSRGATSSTSVAEGKTQSSSAISLESVLVSLSEQGMGQYDRKRAILMGPHVDFLFYHMGKQSPELKAIPRHYYKGTPFY